MKKILIRFYSANNLGDDLFVKILCDRYRNIFTALTPRKYSSLELAPNLVRTYSRYMSIKYTIAEKILHKSNLYLHRLAQKNDLMLYIGGSLFNEDSQSTKDWEKELRFYQQLKKPYYITGSNVGSYKNKALIEILQNIFGGAKDVCFRDQVSYSHFKDLPTTRVSSDIVFTLDTSPYHIHEYKTVIFSVINCRDRFDTETADAYDKATRDMTRSLLGKGYRVVYMSFCKYEGDETAINDILGTSDPEIAKQIEIFKYDGGIDAALNELASCEIVVATRFHAAILGLLFGKKVLPMAYT